MNKTSTVIERKPENPSIRRSIDSKESAESIFKMIRTDSKAALKKLQQVTRQLQRESASLEKFSQDKVANFLFKKRLSSHAKKLTELQTIIS
jgi:predicted translin family RNA/ssDNA-binding protein